ncbi:MAG: ACT domain-containing protein [Peptococcaceae bacterium]|nr:ACT domain-containing protein [Peptococcaceae bacterium]
MKDNSKAKRFIVDERILPNAIKKTAQTKELLAKFKGLTINEAVKQVGLSRSAFYKYRDGVFPFYEAVKEKIVTIQINMEHEVGILSNCLNTVASTGANILTINQGIPTEGIARVTISFELRGDERYDLEMMLESLYDIAGVISVEPIGQN